MAAPINVLVFTWQFYHQKKKHLVVSKALEVVYYAAAVYSSTKSVQKLF